MVASTFPLQDAILASSLAGIGNTAMSIAKTSWCNLARTIEPTDASKHIRRARSDVVASSQLLHTTICSQRVLHRSTTPDWQQLLRGDLLHAPLLIAVGLCLSDEAIRVAIGFLIGPIYANLIPASVSQRSKQAVFMVWHVERIVNMLTSL